MIMMFIQYDNETNMRQYVMKNVRRLRELRALSLSDLSTISGISRVTINRVENGKQKPMPRTVRKLAQALNVEVEDITSTQTRLF